MAKLTPAACRAGRALLKWSTRDLASHSGVAWTTINAIENGSAYRQATETKLLEAFDRHGVEITNGDGTGARLRAGGSGRL